MNNTVCRDHVSWNPPMPTSYLSWTALPGTLDDFQIFPLSTPIDHIVYPLLFVELFSSHIVSVVVENA